MNRKAIILLLSGVFPVTSCGGGGGASGSQPVTPTVSSVAASCTPTSVPTGQTSQCSAVVSGTGSYSTSVTWSVSPTSIGTVSSSGVFKPASVGTATITATSTQDSTKSGNATVTVTLAAPSNLVYPQTTISASVGQAIAPDTPTVTGTVSSYSASPALPAGLSLNTSTGAISGTPTAAAAQTAYTVTATNSSGNTTAIVTITFIQTQNTLLELGHASPIQAIRFEGGRVLSADQTGHWVLWNYTSGALLASGDGTQTNWSSGGGFVANPIDMAGQTVIDQVANGLEIRAQSDGHLLSTIAYPGLNISGPSPWWKLASDGSYVCIGSKTGLFVYTLAGQIAASESGDYSLANIFAAPGQVLVALGPAGQNVIESISTVDGTSSVSPTFSGQFNSWFVDGARFLTNLSTTVWVYSNTGVQQAIVALPTITYLTGQGNWIWTYDGTVDIYPIGSETPAVSFNVTGSVYSGGFASGTTIGFASDASGTGGPVSVIDLSGSTPSETDYTVPIAYLTTFAASSSSQWIVGNGHGALLDGASLSSTPRYFGQGEVWSIAGSSSSVAISTAIGKISIFDPYQSTLKETINFSSGKLALSADGTVLGASANVNDLKSEPDRTLNFYSLPSGNVVSSFPYNYNVSPSLFDFTLATSGSTIGRVTGTLSGSAWSYARQVTPITGGSATWSDTGNSNPILLSPDGTLVAEYNYAGYSSSVTSIFKNGTLVTAVPGAAVGWIDNNRILVNQYVLVDSRMGTVQYGGCTIYSSAGVQLATPPLPELKSIQTVNSDSVYDPAYNTIYSLTTGQPIWTGSYPGSVVGAVAGAYVVYESGHSVVVESF